MIKEKLHKAICDKQEALETWYDNKRAEVSFAITTSIDIRDAGFKISSVDANIYPAGFNNICEADRESAPEILKDFISRRYKDVKNIMLLSEEHTNNPYYWENVYAFSEIIRKAGFELRITMPREEIGLSEMKTSSGKLVSLTQVKKDGKTIIGEDGFRPDLVISNNDFSDSREDWFSGLDLTMNPPRELGWYQRKKSTHFEKFNSLVEDFAKIIDVDPWLMTVPTKLMKNFDPNDEQAKKDLSEIVKEMLVSIQNKYDEHGITAIPSVFIKNNSGTYGLAVTKVTSAEEVLSWNNKTRTKMKAAKGGSKVSEIIVQEGIPTEVKSDGAAAEPVIYMFACQLIGGFLRAHSKKSENDSLNSPGAIYKRMCMTDLRMEPDQYPEENVCGWMARLASLAVAYEAKQMGVEFKNYQL